jgi:DNA-binding HxlR family transcriptional regulator
MPADETRMESRGDVEPQICEHFQEAAALIARRWNPLIVGALLGGVVRFTDIRNAIPGLSDRLLSSRLKELETAGVVTRRVIPDTPVRIEYGLTSRGRDLVGVIDELRAWAERWAPAGTPAHQPLARPGRASLR